MSFVGDLFLALKFLLLTEEFGRRSSSQRSVTDPNFCSIILLFFNLRVDFVGVLSSEEFQTEVQ